MKCRNCNNINPKSALKCNNCNAPLDGSMIADSVVSDPRENGEVICKNCRSQNSINALRCQVCNAPLEGSMVLNSNAQPHLKESQVQCKNCKTSNQADALKCINCNAPLDGSMVLFSNPTTAKRMEHTTAPLLVDQQAHPSIQCVRCFYPNESGSSFCLQCGQELSFIPITKEKEKNQNNTGNDESPTVRKTSSMTINPWIEQAHHIAQFSLVPIEPDKKVEKSELLFVGSEVVLNRENLDKGNNTITSDVQASISYDQDGWSIENKSVMQTTFIRVDSKVKLHDGDIILMGNRLFKFKSEEDK